MTNRDSQPRLGRGLAALIAEMAPVSKGSVSDAIRMLAVDRLEPSRFQPRADIGEAALEELAASIRTRGLLQPLLVRPHPAHPERFEIVAGERRWRAAQKAGLSDVPVLVRSLGEADAMAAALVENLQRQDLNAIEEADGYRRLQDEFGLTQDQLAEAVGKSRSHVANMTRLLRLPGSVQAEVRRGILSAGHARALLSHHDPVAASLAVIARGLNVRQTEQLTARSGRATSISRRSAGPAAPTATDSDTAAVERDLMTHLGIRVSIKRNGDRGTVQLHYVSHDQLDGLVRLLMA